MADQPRNFRDRDDSRNMNRDYDPRLDDRTGVGPGSPGGYRAADPRYARGARSDDRFIGDGPDYAEARSFDPADAYHADFAHGRAVPRRHELSPEEYRRRRAVYRGADFGSRSAPEHDYWRALAESRYAAGNFQSYPFDAYDSSWGIGSSFGFGQELNGPNPPAAAPHPRAHGRHFWDKASDEVSSWFGDEAAHLRRDIDRGEHAGRGPRGYKRSESRIREDVSDYLTNDSWLDASEIEVTVKDGDVTLDGKVASREDKRRAELWAESVSGVDHVQNNLRIDHNMRRRDPDRILASDSTLVRQAKGNA